METKLWFLRYLCLFGIRFLGVTFTLVPPVKPDYTVDEYKVDLTEAVSIFLHTNTSSGAGAGTSD